MKVRELINALTYCNMEAEVDLHTTNTDAKGRSYSFALDSVDSTMHMDTINLRTSINLMFRDWRFDGKGYKSSNKQGALDVLNSISEDMNLPTHMYQKLYKAILAIQEDK